MALALPLLLAPTFLLLLIIMSSPLCIQGPPGLVRRHTHKLVNCTININDLKAVNSVGLWVCFRIHTTTPWIQIQFIPRVLFICPFIPPWLLKHSPWACHDPGNSAVNGTDTVSALLELMLWWTRLTDKLNHFRECSAP